MSKRRVSSSQRASRSKGTRRAKTSAPKLAPTKLSAKPSSKNSSESRLQRFLGVSLLGGKSDRTSLAILEYYPEHKKLFLSQLFEKIRSDDELSADQKLLAHISEFDSGLESVSFDVPLELPVCFVCRPKCPSYEECREPETQWMWKVYRQKKEENKNLKLFTPYTQRPVEFYLSYMLDEDVIAHDALGANMAPLTARAQFLKKRLKHNLLEVHPHLTFARLGKSLGVAKRFLTPHNRIFEQDEARQAFLNALLEQRLVFIYQQDIQRLIDNRDVFHAFLCALTGFLAKVGECEERPRDFPTRAAWIHFPKDREQVNWFR